MPEGDGSRILASDFDGTVVGTNTFPHFVRFLARQLWRSRRLPALLGLLAVVALRKVRLAGHHHLKAVVCRLGATVADHEVAEWARSVLDRHSHPEVVEMIDRWPGRTILTTAAPEVYAVHFARLLGIPEVHGSVVQGWRLTNNESEAKVVRLRAAGADRLAVFITDDLVVDAPVAALAARVHEVRAGGSVREVA